MEVLIIVDVQNDFCPGGALAVREGDQIIPVINKLMQSGIFDRIVASQDWHPGNHVSFANNHPGCKAFTTVEVDGQSQKLWPSHCVKGSHGAKLHSALNTDLIHYFIKKGTNPKIDSYSAFFDNQHKSSTTLLDILTIEAREKGIDVGQVSVTIVGLATDYCVAATALDSVRAGFKTTVVVDGCRAVNVNSGDSLGALRSLVKAGVQLCRCQDILPQWERVEDRFIANNPSPGQPISVGV